MPELGSSKKMKKAAIYDPYLDTLGGGERYCLTVAEILLKNGYKVDLFWSKDKTLINTAQKRFFLNISDINIVPDIFGLSVECIDLIENKEAISNLSKSRPPLHENLFKKISNFVKKIKITNDYDLFFYLSNGSTPFLFAKDNFLHIQVPLVSQINFYSKFSLFFKRFFLKNIIFNSEFTANFFTYQFPKKTKTIYPPVDVKKFSASQPKENIIISVGRFDNILNSKKQDILIKCFKTINQHNKDWKLVLAGASLDQPEKNSFLNHLKFLSKNLPVEFVINPDFDTLKNLYSKAKIYWHAAGYSVNQQKHPEETEHFGITVVEAMASGLVPLVVAKGGLPEIVKNDRNGYLWTTESELVAKTQLLIADSKLLGTTANQARMDSNKFSKENFETNFLSLITK